MAIPIGRPGLILDEDEETPHILVEDHEYKTGGYLILRCISADFKSGIGYDDWVLKEDLEAYFEESGWTVVWS